MSLQSHHKFKHRVLFQLNNETNIQESNDQNPIPKNSGNGSEIFPQILPEAAGGFDNEETQAKKYSLQHHGTGSDLLNASHGANNDVIIPIPDWSTALREWGAWWDIHVYGTALLFLALAFVSVAIFVRFRDRVVRFQIVLNTLVLLATSGLFRAMFLLVDAYGHQNRMSGYLLGIMTQAVYPLLCACFGLTQVMLVKVTNIDVGPKKFRSLSSLLGCTLGYLFLIVVVESIVYLEPHLKLFLLLDSGCFIAWSLYLAITFICSGFRLSQYTSETKKARKQLNAFSIQRRCASNTNTLSTVSNSSNDACFNSIPAVSSDVTQTPQANVTDFSEETTSASFPSSSSCSFSNYAHSKSSTIRLSRPKMKIADHNHMTIAMVTDDDDESTSSTDVEQSSFDVVRKQKVHKTCIRHQRKSSSKARTKAQYKTKHDAAVDRLLSLPNDTKSCDIDVAINNNNTFSHFSIAKDKKKTYERLKNNHNKSTKTPEDNETSDCEEENQQECLKNVDNHCHVHSSKDISMNVTIASINSSPKNCGDIQGALGFRDNNGILLNDIVNNGDIKTQGCERSGPVYPCTIEPDKEISLETDIVSSSVKENGYLADTENVVASLSSPKPTKPRSRTSGRNHLQYVSEGETTDTKGGDSDDEYDDDDDDDDNSPPLALSDRMPANNTPAAIMSLFRIRQSKMVQRAVHLTYFLTFLFVFSCLMQLYTVFGVYGGLGRIRKPHPWPWLLFHTIFRLLECSIGFTCATIAFITLNYRHQRAKRRLQQQQQQQHHPDSRHSYHQQQHRSSDQHEEQQSDCIDTRECVV